MSDGPGAEEPTMDELLDNTPEAVAMRRARAAWAEAGARTSRQPPAKGATRRRLVLGGVLGAVAVARALARVAGTGGGRP